MEAIDFIDFKCKSTPDRVPNITERVLLIRIGIRSGLHEETRRNRDRRKSPRIPGRIPEHLFSGSRRKQGRSAALKAALRQV